MRRSVTVQVPQLNASIVAYMGIAVHPKVLFLTRQALNIQSTLAISTSIISNNRLSQRENLVLV